MNELEKVVEEQEERIEELEKTIKELKEMVLDVTVEEIEIKPEPAPEFEEVQSE